MRRFTSRNYYRLLQWVMEKGDVVTVGDTETIEMKNANLMLRNPLDRLVISDTRKLNFPFGIAEWIGLVTGESRVEFFNTFIKGYDKYSTGGFVVDGSYGERLHLGPESQISGVLKELRRDINSRRAVVTLYDGPSDLFGGGGVNTPCTLSLQYLVRNGHLHAITTMRSNDAIWGFNYDMMMFTLLQEFIARQLSLELGNYFHNAGSFHIYDKHYDLVDGMAKDARWPFTMRQMPHDISFKDVEELRSIYLLVDDERIDIPYLVSGLRNQWLRDLAWSAFIFVNRKDQATFDFGYHRIEDITIRKVMRPWAPKV